MSSPKTSTQSIGPSIYWVLLALMIIPFDLILGEISVNNPSCSSLHRSCIRIHIRHSLSEI